MLFFWARSVIRSTFLSSAPSTKGSTRTSDLEELSLPSWYNPFLVKNLYKLCLGLAGFLGSSQGETVVKCVKDGKPAQMGHQF